MSNLNLNKKQEDFLLAISRNKNECIRTIGRRIYSTDVSCYNIRDLFLGLNLITIFKIRTKETPILTIKGKEKMEEIYQNRLKPKGL